MAAEETKPAATAQAQPATQAQPVVEKQTNCLACNKPIRKLKKYYRDGKFYCSKKCWMKFLSSKKEKAEEK